MRIIEPIAITEAMMLASNVAETDAPAWDAAASYTAGDPEANVPADRVLRGHAIYQAVAASTGRDPLADTASAFWVRLGATNRWRAFDKLISDPVTQSGDITYRLRPDRRVDAIAFFGVAAASIRVTVTDPVDGVTYDRTHGLVDNSAVTDWWSYFFEPVIIVDHDVSEGIPAYTGTQIDITLSSDGLTSVGQIVLGQSQRLGETLVETGIGLADFSIKERDAWGNAIIVERPYSDATKFQFSFPTAEARRIRKILAGLRATPAVYYAGDETGQFGTTVYGFFKDFWIPLTCNVSFGNLEVEGLT